MTTTLQLEKRAYAIRICLALLHFSKLVHYNGLNYLVAQVAGELPMTNEFSCLLL